jgi:hypothetical protein
MVLTCVLLLLLLLLLLLVLVLVLVLVLELEREKKDERRFLINTLARRPYLPVNVFTTLHLLQ